MGNIFIYIWKCLAEVHNNLLNKRKKEKKKRKVLRLKSRKLRHQLRRNPRRVEELEVQNRQQLKIINNNNNNEQLQIKTHEVQEAAWIQQEYSYSFWLHRSPTPLLAIQLKTRQLIRQKQNIINNKGIKFIKMRKLTCKTILWISRMFSRRSKKKKKLEGITWLAAQRKRELTRKVIFKMMVKRNMK